MNKREAQQKLVAYKNEKREENYALEHGILDKFVPKYVEKIPLGNGKFKYLYQEDIDRMKEAAKGAANKVKDAATSAYNSTKNAISTATNNVKAGAAKGAANKVKDAATSAYNSTKNAISTATNNVKAGAAKVADKMSDTAAEAKTDIARGAAKAYDRLQSLIAPNSKTLSERSVRNASQSAREDMAKNKKSDVEMAREETMAAKKAASDQAKADAARAKEADLREKAAKRMGAPTLEEMRQTTAEIRAKQSDRYKKGLETENKSKGAKLTAELSYELKQNKAKNPTVKGSSDRELIDAVDSLLRKEVMKDDDYVSTAKAFNSMDNPSHAAIRTMAKAALNKLDALEKQYLPLNDKGDVLMEELSREQKALYYEIKLSKNELQELYDDPTNIRFDEETVDSKL